VWKLATIAVLSLSCAARDKHAPAQVSPAFRPFQDAVKRYLETRETQKDKLPKLADRAEPEQIAAHKISLREGIRGARARARQGDVFVEPVRPFFVKAILAEMTGPGAATAKQTVMHSNPKSPGVPGDVKVAVNAVYPSTAPLATLPPTLLLRLPTLPEELEYRFVGRHLVLRDVDAAMIVDYIPNALPAAGASSGGGS
jgi:hypothetical protein